MVSTIVLVLEAAFFALTSAYSFVRPIQFAIGLGLGAEGAAGKNEIRAQYGGFFGAAALLQIAAVAGWIAVNTGLLIGAMIFGGLIFGRILATLLNRGVTGYTVTIRALLVIDLVGFLACVVALQVTG